MFASALSFFAWEHGKNLHILIPGHAHTLVPHFGDSNAHHGFCESFVKVVLLFEGSLF